MIVGYARVSTGLQNTDTQRFEIKTYAAESGIAIDMFVQETISSRKKLETRALFKLMNDLSGGDTIIVTEVSRLGRSMFEVMTLLGKLLERGIKVYATKQKWHLGNSMVSKAQLMSFAFAADLERELISQRTKDGLARAVANGRVLGRKVGSLSTVFKCDAHRETIVEDLANGKKLCQIAKAINVDRATLSKYIKEQINGDRTAQLRPAVKKIKPTILQEVREELPIIVEKSSDINSAVASGAKIWAYIRVSTDKQTNENQHLQISQLMQRSGWQVYEWCEEVISSRIDLLKRSIWAFVNKIHSGDVLVIAEISRLGRSQGEILRIFEALLKKGVIIYSIRDNYSFGDNAGSKIIIGTMSMAAQIERELISQRTIEALKVKRAQGVVFGRPKGVKNSTPYKKSRFRAFIEPYKQRILEGAKRWETLADMVANVADANFTKASVRTYITEIFKSQYENLCARESGYASRTSWAFMTNLPYIEKAMNSGKKIAQICKKIGIAAPKFQEHFVEHFKKTASQYRKEAGVKAERKRSNKAPKEKWHDAKLLGELLALANADEIAKNWGCSPQTIRLWAKKHGLK